MELGPLSESASYSATQEYPKMLWNRKVHYHVHKSPSLLLILNRISPVSTTTPYLFKNKNKQQTPWPESASNLDDRTTAVCRQS
jgi:hypothetical protein